MRVWNARWKIQELPLPTLLELACTLDSMELKPSALDDYRKRSDDIEIESPEYISHDVRIAADLALLALVSPGSSPSITGTVGIFFTVR